MASTQETETPKLKKPIPTSPAKLTPVVLSALHVLLAIDKPALAQLLLLGQDVVDYIVPAEGTHYDSINNLPISPWPDFDVLRPTLLGVNDRFLGKNEGAWSKAHEFMDVNWCQDYLDALYGMELGYPLAVGCFIEGMIHYGTCGPHSKRSVYMPSWERRNKLRTLNALAVIRVVGALQEKPQWETKVENEEIVGRWKAEALAQGLDPTVVDIAVEDLKWLRKKYDPLTGSILTHIPRVYVTNSLIGDGDLQALKDIVATLGDVSENLKDWHPDSDGQVLDLVYPSLHPYVRGRTPRYVPEQIAFEATEANPSDIERMALNILRVYSLPVRHTYASPETALSSIGEGSPTSEQSAVKDAIEVLWSRDGRFRRTDNDPRYGYQWLPTDVEISLPPSESDDIPSTFPTARFLSYINNLLPDPSRPSGKLYPVLERIFAKFVPLFERALCLPLEPGRPKFPEPDYPQTDEEDGDVGENVSLGQNLVATDGEEEAEEDLEEEGYSWGPKPRVFKFKHTEPLQVIVKLANIHLTPDKPDYPGGSWHVEGTDTEQIVATGIYYYDSENITASRLSFRVAVEDPDTHDYQQDRFGPLARKYGIFQSGPANQILGSAITEQGRCIAFPNNMQHRVEPFSLADSTKPGHRKILAFFLVNPCDRVLSTSDVPPQQFEWYASEIRKGKSRLTKLPTEIFNLIMTHAAAQASEEGYPWPMSWEEALKHRELLMQERGKFAVRANGEAYEREFSFCEH